MPVVFFGGGELRLRGFFVFVLVFLLFFVGFEKLLAVAFFLCIMVFMVLDGIFCSSLRAIFGLDSLLLRRLAQ